MPNTEHPSPIERFRHKMHAGQICIGASITFTDPLVTDALGDAVDFFWIDLEHCLMSFEALHGHFLAAARRGVPALVRVSGSDTPFIKPVLDAGADGIIAPQVRSADEVRRIVRDCRYPPLGQRGYGPRVPSNYGRDGDADFVARANRDLFVAVQIETVEAFAELDEIVTVQGLDSLVLGPWDLSGSLGVLGQVEHPTVVEAIKTTIAKARAANLFVGSGMGADGRYAAVMARRGVQWLQVGADYAYLVNFMGQLTTHLRDSIG